MATVAKTKSKANIQQSGKQFWMLALIASTIIILIGMMFWWRDMASAAQPCKTADLKLTAGQQSGAAGTIYQHMTLTNTSNRKCHMSGFPTAFLYGSNGYAIGNSAAARTQPVPVDITLAPNESANTVLGYPQAGNFDPGVCSSTTSISLALFPPSSVTALTTPLTVAWCPGFSESSMQSGN